MPRKPRYFDRTQKLNRARAAIEDNIAATAGRGLRLAYRHVLQDIKHLQKQSEGFQWWDGWRTDFELAFRERLAADAIELLEIELRWYEQLGLDVVYDPNLFLDSYNVGAKIVWVTDYTRQATEAIIRQWYTTDEGMAPLVKRLSFIYGEYRARLIGITETTMLASGVTGEMMRAAGLDRWTWQTRKDDIVCPVCRALGAGGPYTMRDSMPPDASHPGCRCGSAPIVPALSKLWAGVGLSVLEPV